MFLKREKKNNTDIGRIEEKSRQDGDWLCFLRPSFQRLFGYLFLGKLSEKEVQKLCESFKDQEGYLRILILKAKKMEF